jgi:hypothetical protein
MIHLCNRHEENRIYFPNLHNISNPEEERAIQKPSRTEVENIKIYRRTIIFEYINAVKVARSNAILL